MRDHTRNIGRLVENYLNNHFRQIWQAQKSGRITPTPQQGFLYPTHLLLVESPTHIIAEVTGCRANFNDKLTVAKRSIQLTEDHFDQFGTRDNNPAIAVGVGHMVLQGLTFARAGEAETLTDRLPSVRGFGNKYQLRQASGSGSLITFDSEIEACVLRNCNFINAKSGIYRLKAVPFALIMGKGIGSDVVSEVLKRELAPNTAGGVVEPPNSMAAAMVLSGQFQSLYLSPTVHETTIGSFLAAHPQILRSGLGATDHVYEPILPWVDHPPGVESKSINPDMLLKRPDGLWDIIDFKTAALDRKNLTKGGAARKRFIDYVYEGIAQLANYAEYFSFPANRDLAATKYGVDVSSPRLVLVVGSIENHDQSEIRLALRAHPNMEVVDYDTLLRAYLASVEATSESPSGTITPPADPIQGVYDRSESEAERRAGQAPNLNWKVGRNERCPCGSGIKFKRCHGAS